MTIGEGESGDCRRSRAQGLCNYDLCGDRDSLRVSMKQYRVQDGDNFYHDLLWRTCPFGVEQLHVNSKSAYT
ncbi:hypothetical protein Ccrd_005952 [Cynara cardunculus var. scolymus]|uniref:Uncharacterized protein n=1 Tax=Cynara cardunculus var. scolymus TaxID=59895 RepID=A0A103XJP5_CYNCS|nr:hypothetical protein Ccrd_005952 [Cynara cardunculus var. scolymus]